MTMESADPSIQANGREMLMARRAHQVLGFERIGEDGREDDGMTNGVLCVSCRVSCLEDDEVRGAGNKKRQERQRRET